MFFGGDDETEMQAIVLRHVTPERDIKQPESLVRGQKQLDRF